MRDAAFAGRRKRIGPCPSEENEVRAQREHADDVQPRTHATVGQYGNSPRYALRYPRQCARRRTDAVQLPSTVVGDDDPVRPIFHRLTGVVWIEDALDDKRALP